MDPIGIIGSCVTRDVWRILKIPTSNVKTFSRTGLASLMSPVPENLSMPDGTGALEPDGFLARCVRADVEKTALQTLESWQPRILFFDFVDERFDLLQAGNTIVSDSFEFWRSGLRARSPFIEGRPIRRVSGEADELWRDGLAKLRKRIANGPLASATIVLHAASWAESYRQADGLRPFPHKMKVSGASRAPAESVDAHRALLRRYHEAFLNAFPSAIVIAPPDSYRVGDPEHPWGLSPHHFIGEYYTSFRDICRERGLLI